MTTREQLQAEAERLTKIIHGHEEEYKNALRMTNLFRRQLKGVEREIAKLPEEKSDGEQLKDIAEGMNDGGNR
jgi:hypothetical protein